MLLEKAGVRGLQLLPRLRLWASVGPGRRERGRKEPAGDVVSSQSCAGSLRCLEQICYPCGPSFPISTERGLGRRPLRQWFPTLAPPWDHLWIKKY